MKCTTCGVDATPKWYYKKTNPTCCKCYSRVYRKNNPEKVKKTLAKYASSDKGREREKRYSQSDKGKASNKRRQQRYMSNPENYKKAQDYWRSEHRKELSRESYKRIKEDRPNYYAAKRAERRAKQNQARPEWVDKEEIQEIFDSIPDDGKDYEIDHIIPLNNKKVSGLDVPSNLQVLERSENRKKSNKFDGTYENSSWREV